MMLFGGMSKGERTRIKTRVRTAMSAQAAMQGRFLGGRPPYGYLLADVGPHPNPAEAGDGKRLHQLEPDPATAPTVHRIFDEYLAGRGYLAIAERLTGEGFASPSGHDRERNRHRHWLAWGSPRSEPSSRTLAIPATRCGRSSGGRRSSSTSRT